MGDKMREQLIQSERRAHSLQNELEESKTQLEHADRSRRSAEQELSDVLEQLSDATMQNQALQASKRKLESEMQTLHADLEEMLGETRLSEEKLFNVSSNDLANLKDSWTKNNVVLLMDKRTK